MRLTFIRSISFKNTTGYVVPQTYKPNRTLIQKLPFKYACKVWLRSLKPNRLEEVQSELVELMIPTKHPENKDIIREFKQVKISRDDHLNEVGLKVINGEGLKTKHIVFVHGYGASLGCFARNFQLINKFKQSKKYNYHIHFLDNLTFGLSSNPKIKNDKINYWKIPRCASIRMVDNVKTDSKSLYKKYYKLIEGYRLHPENFEEYRRHFTPILKDLEDFYCGAIEEWRKASGIEKIDFLVGHSYGGYWSGLYSLKYPDSLSNLILLSPVGVERHVHAVTNTEISTEVVKPSLDPTSFKFLTRLPILSAKHVKNWYNKQPFLPRILPFLGPWGVQKYFEMWLSKLFKINKLVDKHGGPNVIFSNNNDLIYGKKKEIAKLVEYLFNSITLGTNSDIYIKYLLTPATVSKWPLYDKFTHTLQQSPEKLKFNIHLMYGQYDFMNSEAGAKLIEKLNNELPSGTIKEYSEIPEGGHNLYIDNPFDTNQKIYEIVMNQEKEV